MKENIIATIISIPIFWLSAKFIHLTIEMKHNQNRNKQEALMCDCDNTRRDEDRMYTITVKAYITVDACCEDVAVDNFSISDADDYEVLEVEEA